MFVAGFCDGLTKFPAKPEFDVYFACKGEIFVGFTNRGRMAAAMALGCGAILAATPALADVKDGVDAWSRGDYKAAIREWKEPAAKGDPDAQFNLAQAYKLGRGVERNLPRAQQLFGEAAARGHLQAADNYGLLLFQGGQRAKAMPFIHAASDRGDPRAQYVLGLAYFNGDTVPKDWQRAYALVSLAQQAGLPQAAGALSQMDKHIPLEQRQRSVALAAELASKAQATRQRQVAAADLGVTGPGSGKAPANGTLKPFRPANPQMAKASRPIGHGSPATAGADYARPQTAPPTGVPRVSSIMKSAARAPAAQPKPAPKPDYQPVKPRYAAVSKPAAARPAPAQSANGAWRVQLGAFGVAGNASRLWNRVKGRPELAGHGKLTVPAGRVTKLQAGGFASRADAQSACNRLKAGGFDCIAVR